MFYRRLLVLALIAGLPGIVQAQFTTFIPPKPEMVDSVKAVVAAAKVARTDSVMNVRMADMKTWVDSAAGVAPIARTAADSQATAVMVPSSGMSADTSGYIASTSTTMTNGSRAPATASLLPMIAVLGAATFSVGLLLVKTPKRARQRG